MSDLDEIKSRLNIVDVVSSRIHLKKAGRNFKANCPFHQEKTPSFVVSPDRQIFHCFGCGKGGSVVDFIMLYDHIDFLEALEDLAELAGVKLERRSFATPEDKIKQKLLEINHLASEFYHFLLTQHPVGEKARSYLKNRGVSDKSIKTFSLGYSPNSWEGVSKFLQKKGYTLPEIEQAGLVIKSPNRYYDRFRGRVIFTLKDHRGRVVGFSGRVLDPEVKEAKYINTNETPVYNKSQVLYGLDVTKDSIQKENEAILMEGELDVISSFQAGIGNAVAIKGSALTEGHARLLRRFAEKLVFALDSDFAGDAAARRGIEMAETSGFDMRVAVLSGGKDPDEIARENAVQLKKDLQSAIPIYDFYLSSALKRFDITTPFGKKKVGEEMLPIIGKIDNSIVQNHYFKKIAKILEVTEDSIMESLRKLRQNAGVKVVTAETKTDLPTRTDLLEIYLLALLLQGETKEWWEEFNQLIKLTELTNPAVRQILELLREYLKTHNTFLLKDFADDLPKQLVATFDEAFLWDLSDSIDNEIESYREWDKTMQRLRKELLKRQIKNLTKEIDHSGEEKESAKLQEELSQMTNLLKELEKTD